MEWTPQAGKGIKTERRGDESSSTPMNLWSSNSPLHQRKKKNKLEIFHLLLPDQQQPDGVRGHGGAFPLTGTRCPRGRAEVRGRSCRLLLTSVSMNMKRGDFTFTSDQRAALCCISAGRQPSEDAFNLCCAEIRFVGISVIYFAL